MNALFNVLFAFFIALGTAVCAVLWIINKRSFIISRAGALAYLLICIYVVLLTIPPLGWLIAYLPPFNNPVNPVFSGIGGAPFGLEVVLFPKVSVAIALMTLISCSLLHVLLRVLSPILPDNYAMAGEIRVLLSSGRISIVARCVGVGGVLLSVLFFQSFGWGLILSVDTTRWDALRSDSIGLYSNFKVSLFVLFAGGVLSGVFAVLNLSRVLNLLSWLLVCLAFLAQSSRGFTILVATLLLTFLWRASSRLRVVLILPVVFVVFLAYLIPLRSRGLDRSGAINALQEVPEALAGGSFIKDIRGLSFNSGIGYGLLVEVEHWKQSGYDIMGALPLGYVLRMFSPFPSFLDGYSQGYWYMKPRVNPFTPLSTIAEMYAWSFWLPGFYLFVSIASLVLCLRSVSKRSQFNLIAVSLFGLSIFYCINMQQYDTRTVTRFIYFTMYIALIFNFLSLITGRNTVRRPTVRERNVRRIH